MEIKFTKEQFDRVIHESPTFQHMISDLLFNDVRNEVIKLVKTNVGYANMVQAVRDEYSGNSHLIYSNGYEQWKEYDENGNMIHMKDSNGYEQWKEYDENGNMIHMKDSNGYEQWYDKDGNVIPDPNKVTELTLEEIAEKLNIPVENLRIKEFND